jgi:bla regulator protein blaR1
MTTDLWLRNLTAFGFQSGVLVAGGYLLAKAFRLDEPRAALAYWRVILVVCLLLPFCQPWHAVLSQAVVIGETSASIPQAGARTVSVAEFAAAPAWPSIERLIAIALWIGIAVRAAWLAIGAWVLGRIRHDADALDPVPDAIARAQDLVGTSAALCVSTRVAGPITFGLRRPVIVFPPTIASLEPSVQHAIACHELLHVRRRDWMYQVLEEGVRTLLWFHPGVWWLVGRIQLTREQVVDQESIALVDSRERYVEALLAVAIGKSPGFLTPAPAFFRRSLLKKRVAQILQEKTMTTRRLMISLGASAAALALAATFAVRSFPLQAQGQPRSAGAKPVEIVKGGEHLLHGELPEYPRHAMEQKVEGDVLLDIAVDDTGEVSDARVLSGPDELRKAALSSVLSWHFSPSALRSASTQATLRFTLAAANTTYRGKAYTAEKREEKEELSDAQRLEHLQAELQEALRDPNLSPSKRDEFKTKAADVMEKLEHIRAERVGDKIRVNNGEAYQGPLHLVAFKTERVSPDAAGEVLKRSGLKVGDAVTEASLKQLRAAAVAVDEHFEVAIRHDGRGGVSAVLVSRE